LYSLQKFDPEQMGSLVWMVVDVYGLILGYGIEFVQRLFDVFLGTDRHPLVV